MTGEHLQISDIALLQNRPLPGEEVREVSRHLLTCRECRDLLPRPSRQEFLKTVFGETDHAAGVAFSTGMRNTRLVALVGGFRSMFRPALAFGLLVVIATGIGVLFLSLRQAKTDGELVAVVVEPEPTANDPILTIPDRGISLPTYPNPKVESNQRRESEKVRRIEGSERLKETKRRSPQASTLYESGTRGTDVQCGGITSISLGASALKDGIRLTWEKVNNASKYSIYISDLDEKLIDEFETDNATSYMSKAEFAQDIVYKWRLIVTLKDGHTLVGTSTKFTLGGLDGHSKDLKNFRFQKNGPTNIRCVENK